MAHSSIPNRADTSAYLAMFKEMKISWGIEELEKNYFAELV